MGNARQSGRSMLAKRTLGAALSAVLLQGACEAAYAQMLQTAPRADASDTSNSAGTLSGFKLVPGLAAGVSYDSNVYATPSQPQSDLLFTLSPSLQLTGQGEGHSLSLGVQATETRYRSNPTEDSTDYQLDASGRQRVNANGEVFGGVGYAQAHEDRTSPDDVLGTRPTVFTDASAYLGLSQRWSAVSLRVGGTFDHLLFRNVRDAAGDTIDNADRNRDVVGIGLRLGYALSPHVDLFTQGTYDARTYARRLDDNGLRRDSQGDSWVVGVASRDTRDLRGELYAGWLSQHYADPRLPAVAVPTAGARLSWQAAPGTTLDANLSRAVEETTLPGTSSYVDTSLGLQLRRVVNDRLTARAGVDLTRSDFRGIARRDDLLGADVGMSYRISRNLLLDANYQLLQRRSNVPDAEYGRNAIYVGLRMDRGVGTLAEHAPAMASAPMGALAGGFYIGAGAGHGAMDTRVTGLRGEHGTYRGDFAGQGASEALFAGYGLAIGRWYLAAETNLENSRIDWLHDKTPSSRVFATDQRRTRSLAILGGPLLPGGNLLFASAARLRAGFDSRYAVEDGTSQAQENARWANAYGLGIDAPLSRHLFARAHYQVAHFEGYDVRYEGGEDRFAGSVGQFLLGAGWRFGGAPEPTPSDADLDGFYAGAQGGDNRFGSRLDAIQRQAEVPQVTQFRTDFGGRGTQFGAFAGYGHRFGPVYAGIEVESDADNMAWYHEKQPGGRTFSTEWRGSYGASLRLGYATRYGGLLYLRGGRIKARFATTYVKGENASAWVDRNDTRNGSRFGVGMDVPLTKAVFVRLDYSVTHFGAIAFTTTQARADQLHFANWQYLMRIGAGVRF